MIIGLGKAESMEDDDALSPGMTQILEKIAEQESKYSIIYFLLERTTQKNSLQNY